MARTLALVLLAAVLLAPLADAHALPLRSDPPAGSVVERPPREAVIVFSEPLDPAASGAQVLDRNGTAFGGPARIEDDDVTMRVPLPADLPYGTYTVSWRALSRVDGHSTRGVASFLYPDPSKPLTAADLPPSASAPEVLVGPGEVAARAATFAGFAVALGAATLALAGAAPGDRRRLAFAAAGGAVVAAAASLVLAVAQAAAATGSVGAALADFGATFGRRVGALAVARAALLAVAAALALAALRVRRPERAFAACAVVLGGAALTASLAAHAAALPRGAVFAVATDAAHLVAASVWVGGLVGLAWGLRAEEGHPRAQDVTRFSAVATVASAIVVLTGVGAAIVHVGTWAGLVGSAYGRVLAAKVALVAGMLAFAAWNRFRLLPALAAAGPPARRRLRSSVRAEAALGIAVVVLAGALTALSPPAAVAEAPPPPAVFEASQLVDGVNVTLVVTPAPPSVGFGTFDVFLAEPGGASLEDAREATLRFTPPDRSLGATEVPTTKPHAGHFAAEGSFLTMPGEWTLRVHVRRDAGFDLFADFALDVR